MTAQEKFGSVQLRAFLSVFSNMMVVFGYLVAVPKSRQLRLVNWSLTPVDAKICYRSKSKLGNVAESQQCSNRLTQL